MSRARTWSAAALAIALVLTVGCSRRPTSRQVQAWDAEIAALQTELDSLRARARELADADPRIRQLPEGEVVISVPTAFLRSVIERVIEDVASNITLSLSGIKAHVAKSIKKVVTIGEFVVDVNIDRVTGKLQPGKPDVRFGGNRLSVSLPVKLSEGSGQATVHFVWNGKNVADAVCGDMDITQKLTGSVIPADYVIAGAMKLSLQDNRLVFTPVFPETRVRIRVRPSKQSWAAVDSILEAKHGVCGWVLDRVDVRKLLTGVVEEKGFNVKLPIDKLKPFALPAGVTDSVKVGDRVLAVATRTNTIRVDPDAIWYSASVAVDAELPAVGASPADSLPRR